MLFAYTETRHPKQSVCKPQLTEVNSRSMWPTPLFPFMTVTDLTRSSTPVWTAFITHYVASRTWCQKLERNAICLRELRPHNFSNDYEFQRLPNGAFVLNFETRRGMRFWTCCEWNSNTYQMPMISSRLSSLLDETTVERRLEIPTLTLRLTQNSTSSTLQLPLTMWRILSYQQIMRHRVSLCLYMMYRQLYKNLSDVFCQIITSIIQASILFRPYRLRSGVLR